MKNDFYRYSGVVTCATCRSISGEEAVIIHIIYSMEEARVLLEKCITDFNRTYKDKEDRNFHFEQFKINLETINKVN